MDQTQSEVSFSNSWSILPMIRCPKISFKRASLATLIVNVFTTVLRVTELNTPMSLAFKPTDKNQLQFPTTCNIGTTADDTCGIESERGTGSRSAPTVPGAASESHPGQMKWGWTAQINTHNKIAPSQTQEINLKAFLRLKPLLFQSPLFI